MNKIAFFFCLYSLIAFLAYTQLTTISRICTSDFQCERTERCSAKQCVNFCKTVKCTNTTQCYRGKCVKICSKDSQCKIN